MTLRPKEPPSDNPDEVVAAVLMPNSDVSDSQLTAWLAQQGVSNVTRLAEGFLSVRACRATLREAESMARVEIKRPSKLR